MQLGDFVATAPHTASIQPERRRACRAKSAGVAIITICALLAVTIDVLAQSRYPTRPVRILTTFAPGGGSDILARLLGPPVSEALGQSIVVDNRPGGGGTLAAGMGVRAEPDGYTLVLVSGSFGANAALHNLPYDSVADISPIILIGETGLIAAMHPKTPIHNTKELIEFARANPFKLNFGSAGQGGLGHLTLELFRIQTKTDITHVPYKGSGPVMTALLTGEVQSSFSSMVPSIPHIKAGRLRPIAITPSKRSRALPDVPTISETVPGFEVIHWYGIWGPKGIPKEIVNRLNQEFAKVLATDAMKKWFASEGMEPAGGPPEEFRNRVKMDVEKWKKVVKAANIKAANQ